LSTDKEGTTSTNSLATISSKNNNKRNKGRIPFFSEESGLPEEFDIEEMRPTVKIDYVKSMYEN